MTTRAEYLALAERAERVEGADRELDAAIAELLFGYDADWCMQHARERQVAAKTAEAEKAPRDAEPGDSAI